MAKCGECKTEYKIDKFSIDMADTVLCPKCKIKLIKQTLKKPLKEQMKIVAEHLIK